MNTFPDEAVIRANYLRVMERIQTSAARANRNADEIHLVVVTKGQPLQVVRAAIAAGATRLGENYPEEGVEKILALGGNCGVEWHMIGHVQSRKARMVCEHYTCLHSLDSVHLAQRLDRFCSELGRQLPVFLELNVSGEESKFGFPAWDDNHWESLAVAIEQIAALPNLRVRGLMTMAPYFPQAEQARPFFHRLREWRDRLADRFPHVDWTDLSMGMSSDFEAAIMEGATFVRIGQAILGPRPVSD
jgi:pyridoxal phosphate enzyme (YggS family)